MILFTLDISKKKSIIGYALCSILCIAINYIYSLFGHGVNSNYMKFMFFYPLIGGLLVTVINKNNDKAVKGIFAMVIFTLVVGSFVHGVLEIAGATSPYVFIYYVVSLIMILVGALSLRKNLQVDK